MNSRVLAAGWPFAGLLELEANRVEVVSECARRSGIIARDDGEAAFSCTRRKAPST